MKKLLLSIFLVTTLSGCALFDAYFMAKYDTIEYALTKNDSSTNHRSSPIQLRTGTNWSLTSIGAYNITARRQV